MDWTVVAAYKAEFDAESRVVGLRHVSGDEVKINPKLGFTADWQISEPWDDFAASFVMEPLVPQPLARFFQEAAKEDGETWANTQYSGKGLKQLEVDVSRVLHQYRADLVAAKHRGSASSTSVRDLVTKAETASAKDYMQKCREQLSKKMAERKAAGRIALRDKADSLALTG